MAFVRSYNPKWFFNDLTGQPLNDEYYAHFLTNTLPYIPQVVYRDPQGLTVWTGGVVQFEPSGGLPDNMYFDDELVYRIEIRHGQSQSDALIWEIQNYIPEGAGNNPGTANISSDNQITNPEFVEVNFTGTLTSTSNAIQVAPGWEIIALGTGTINVQRISVTGTDNIITNPAYVLNIITSGSWTSVVLRQRFLNNAALFRGTSTVDSAVAGSFIAKSNGGDFNSGMFYVDSAGNEFNIIPVAAVTGSYQKYSDAVALPSTPQSPDDSDTGYIDIYIRLPNIGDVDISSIQLVKQIEPVAVEYLQESPARQRDHLFHYYEDSILIQPKESFLAGWNFAQNPWQFTTTTNTTPSDSSGTPVKCAYTADQTIVYQQEGASEVLVGRSGAGSNYEFVVTALGSSSRFAIIQYIDPRTIRPYWNSIVSSLVRARISTTHGTTVRFKMRLIARATLPSTIGNAEPILSWTGAGNPVYAAGWTEIIPQNDPTYTLSGLLQDFPFDAITLPISTADAMTLGIVIYTIDGMNNAATADSISFDRISLVPNEFAIDCNTLTYEQALLQCMYYFENSKNLDVLITTSNDGGALYRQQAVFNGSGSQIQLWPRSFGIEYAVAKRDSPTVKVYTEGGLADNVTAFIDHNGAQLGTSVVPITNWTAFSDGNKGIQYIANYSNTTTGFSGTGVNSVNNTSEGYVSFHYQADSRLGR